MAIKMISGSIEKKIGYNFNPFDRGNLVDNIKVWLNPPVDFKSYYFVTRDLML